MEKTRSHQIEDDCKEEFVFFEGCVNALLMGSSFWIAIAVILMW